MSPRRPNSPTENPIVEEPDDVSRDIVKGSLTSRETDKCVGKEWLFSGVADGTIKILPRDEVSHVSDSEDETSAVPVNRQIPYRGSKVLKEIAKVANLKDPSRITSTNDRKQLATMCQILNLSEANQDVLARFMGHDPQIHRDFYRLPLSALEVAKVSKALQMISMEKLREIADRDLDEIDVHEHVEFESNNDESDEENTENTETKMNMCLSLCQKGKRSASSSDEDVDDDVRDIDWKPPKRRRSRRLERHFLNEREKNDPKDV